MKQEGNGPIGNHVFVECWATYIQINHRMGRNIGSKSMEPKSHPSHDFEKVVAYILPSDRAMFEVSHNLFSVILNIPKASMS